MIHELFEEQVERTPNSLAVVCGDKQLTFRELNQQANRLSRQLRGLGIGPDEMVGIFLHRSVEMIVGLLAALKAGGAYLPFDLSAPTELIEYLVQDAKPRVLLTQEEMTTSLPQILAHTICLDASRTGDTSYDDSNPERPVLGITMQHLAYVIYTSGSTGRPKGVMVEHRNVVNLWRTLEERIYKNLGDVQRVGVNASLAFDSSVKQIVQLLSGRTLFVIPQSVRLDATELLTFIAEQRLDCLDCTPTQLRTLISAGMLASDRHVPSIVLVGGESIDVALWSKMASASKVAFFNVYGPTECTVDAAVELARNSPQEITIGTPLYDMQIHLLDDQQRPVSAGNPGEIYIAGAGVARGYLRRPELTAERFLPNPFSGSTASRRYKTGDVGRALPDGRIQHLGRSDRQIKVRGFRVELGEIETQILRTYNVREATVVAREEEPGEKRIIAYIVPSTEYQAESRAATGPTIDEFVQQWQSIHDDYSYVSEEKVEGPNFGGWNSSYTDRPIPEPQMREWLACTVERIEALGPRDVLEIGCGVGLLVEHLAPRCMTYHATDVSAAAVRQLQQWLQQQDGMGHVDVSQRVATDLAALAPQPVDTVILNSVLQFFPNIEYLLLVIERALSTLKPIGRIFIGDVRNLDLQPLFHLSVQWSRAESGTTVEQLRSRVRRAIDQDKDLVVAPEFFRLLPVRYPKISRVDIQLKRGEYSNELTNYRYDVVLHVGRSYENSRPDREINYVGAESVQQFEDTVRSDRSATVRLNRVASRRLALDLKRQQLLTTVEAIQSVAGLDGTIVSADPQGEDPEIFWNLAAQYHRSVNVEWSPDDAQGRFDVEFTDLERKSPGESANLSQSIVPAEPISWEQYATSPINAVRQNRLAVRINESLRLRLPEYMVPSAILVLDAFPTTPNGKIDFLALPPPDLTIRTGSTYQRPVGQTENILAKIWQDLLRIEPVGRQDSFFSLGGNSLVALKMISSVAERFAISISVMAVFRHPSIEQMATLIDEMKCKTPSREDGDASKYEYGMV